MMWWGRGDRPTNLPPVCGGLVGVPSFSIPCRPVLYSERFGVSMTLLHPTPTPEGPTHRLRTSRPWIDYWWYSTGSRVRLPDEGHSVIQPLDVRFLPYVDVGSGRGTRTSRCKCRDTSRRFPEWYISFPFPLGVRKGQVPGCLKKDLSRFFIYKIRNPRSSILSR